MFILFQVATSGSSSRDKDCRSQETSLHQDVLTEILAKWWQVIHCPVHKQTAFAFTWQFATFIPRSLPSAEVLRNSHPKASNSLQEVNEGSTSHSFETGTLMVWLEENSTLNEIFSIFFSVCVMYSYVTFDDLSDSWSMQSIELAKTSRQRGRFVPEILSIAAKTMLKFLKISELLSLVMKVQLISIVTLFSLFLIKRSQLNPLNIHNQTTSTCLLAYDSRSLDFFWFNVELPQNLSNFDELCHNNKRCWKTREGTK